MRATCSVHANTGMLDGCAVCEAALHTQQELFLVAYNFYVHFLLLLLLGRVMNTAHNVKSACRNSG